MTSSSESSTTVGSTAGGCPSDTLGTSFFRASSFDTRSAFQTSLRFRMRCCSSPRRLASSPPRQSALRLSALYPRLFWDWFRVSTKIQLVALSNTHPYELHIDLRALHEDSYEVQNVDTAVTVIRLNGNLDQRDISTVADSLEESTHQRRFGYGCPVLIELFLVLSLQRKICS